MRASWPRAARSKTSKRSPDAAVRHHLPIVDGGARLSADLIAVPAVTGVLKVGRRDGEVAMSRTPDGTPSVAAGGEPNSGSRDAGSRVMIRQFELVELVKSYDPKADEDALNRAYVFSMRAHGSQLRASGDPYFSHPVQVAGLLAQMRLDGASIITGLLHDTVEDTVATLDGIGQPFGAAIAPIVDCVTK